MARNEDLETAGWRVQEQFGDKPLSEYFKPGTVLWRMLVQAAKEAKESKIERR